MVKITKSELYALKIETPTGLNELLEKLFQGGSIGGDFMPARKAPCVIYKEYITAIDGLSLRPFERRIIYARTNHDGLQGAMQHSIDRDILNLRANGIDDSDRGKILVAFCEIEFIVDILICDSLGVYSGLRTYRQVRDDFFAHRCTLFNFEDKRAFLFDNGVIDRRTSDELKTVQRLRNRIAHNYFLDTNMGFGSKSISFYGSVNKAIEMKFNYAWFLLMKIYNTRQVKIVKWAYEVE